jgi:hypothetical protein
MRNFPACSIEKLASTRRVILVRDAIPQLLQSQLEVAMLVGQRHSARRGVAADAEVLCQRRDQLVVARSRSQQFDSHRSDVHVVSAFFLVDFF